MLPSEVIDERYREGLSNAPEYGAYLSSAEKALLYALYIVEYLDKTYKGKEMTMDDKQVVPVLNRVVVRLAEAQEFSEGGIALPETQDKPNYGEVIHIGKGLLNDRGERIPMDVQLGDTVYFARVHGIKTKTAEGLDVVVLKEDEILFAVRPLNKQA